MASEVWRKTEMGTRFPDSQVIPMTHNRSRQDYIRKYQVSNQQKSIDKHRRRYTTSGPHKQQSYRYNQNREFDDDLSVSSIDKKSLRKSYVKQKKCDSQQADPINYQFSLKKINDYQQQQKLQQQAKKFVNKLQKQRQQLGGKMYLIKVRKEQRQRQLLKQKQYAERLERQEQKRQKLVKIQQNVNFHRQRALERKKNIQYLQKLKEKKLQSSRKKMENVGNKLKEKKMRKIMKSINQSQHKLDLQEKTEKTEKMEGKILRRAKTVANDYSHLQKFEKQSLDKVNRKIEILKKLLAN